MFRFAKWLTKVAADDILVAELRPQGGTSQLPVEITVQVHAKDIRAMVVERYFLL